MKTLLLDTSWKNLVIGLFEDGQLIAGMDEEAFKKQSELLFVELEKLLNQADWKLSDVDDVIVTDGPGSYTGLRMAMTTAKLMGTQGKARVHTLSTLQLYAGDCPKANVILDARGGRVYAAHVENGQLTWIGILPLEEVESFLEDNPGELFGEGELIQRESKPSGFLKNGQALLDKAQRIEDVHGLVPRYLKESDAYKA